MSFDPKKRKNNGDLPTIIRQGRVIFVSMIVVSLIVHLVSVIRLSEWGGLSRLRMEDSARNHQQVKIRITDVKPEQYWKAAIPMLVTEFGIVSDVKPEHP